LGSRDDLTSEATQPKQTTSSLPARGTVQLLVARGCFIVSGYLISLILARGLGPVEYGVYSVIMSVLLWGEMLGNAGIPGAMTKLLPQHEHRAAPIEQTARSLLLLISLALFALCWVFAPTLARFFDIPTGTTLFRIAILDLPFNGLYFAYRGALQGHRQFRVLSFGYIIYSLTKLAGIIALQVLGISIAAALIVNVLATIGALVYLGIKVPHRGWVPVFDLVPIILHLALALGAYLIISQALLSLDLWLLKRLWHGPGEVIGLYGAALNVARLPTLVPSVLSVILFASLSLALARADIALAQRYLQAAGRFTLVVLCPFCVLVAFYAEPIMTLLYSDVYAGGGVFLRLQIMAFGLMAFMDIFFHALMAINKHYQPAGILLALTPVAWLFNSILIPKFGAMGAALALVLTLLGGTVAAMLLAYRWYGPLMRLSTVARVTVATACMMLLGAHIPLVGPWLLLEFIVLFGIYMLLLWLLKEINREDLQSFAIWQKSSLS
jgi:stage V sporulation protein B